LEDYWRNHGGLLKDTQINPGGLLKDTQINPGGLQKGLLAEYWRPPEVLLEKS